MIRFILWTTVIINHQSQIDDTSADSLFAQVLGIYDSSITNWCYFCGLVVCTGTQDRGMSLSISDLTVCTFSKPYQAWQVCREAELSFLKRSSSMASNLGIVFQRTSVCLFMPNPGQWPRYRISIYEGCGSAGTITELVKAAAKVKCSILFTSAYCAGNIRRAWFWSGEVS